MLYEEHIELINRMQGAWERKLELIDEREVLFQQTQPGAIRYDIDKVVTSVSGSPIERYAEKIQQLDDRIAEATKIYEYWREAVKEHEAKVNASHFLLDRVYYLHFIKHLHPRKIAARLYYSERWIWKNIEIIKKTSQKFSKEVVK